MRRPRPAALFAAAGVALVPSLASASVLNWANALGGSAGTAANWSPAQVPAAGDILTYNLPGTYTISFPAGAPTASQQNFNAGTISLTAASPHTDTAQFSVGHSAGSNASVRITSGQFTCNGIVSAGTNVGSTGILTVTGPASDLICTGATGVRLGNSGIGTLDIANGGSVRSEHVVQVGALAGSQGALLVSGTNGLSRSELVTLNAVTGDLLIAPAAPASMTVSAGGSVRVADDMAIAPAAGVTGGATLGSAVTTETLLQVAGDLDVAANDTAAAAGTGTLTINDNARADVGGTVTVGDANGGHGTLVFNDASDGVAPSLVTGSLIVQSPNGTLDFRDGLARIEGGLLLVPVTPGSFVLNGSTPAALPTFQLVGAHATFTNLIVGDSRAARITMSSGASLASNNVVLGRLAGSSGTVLVQGGTVALTGTLTVANAGNATFHVTQGSVTAPSVSMGATGAGSLGLLTIEGPSSSLSTTSGIFVGTTPSSGAATLRVVNSGTVHSDTLIRVMGGANSIELDNGTITAPTLRLESAADLRGSGRVDASIATPDSSQPTITATGTLDLGSAASANGFDLAGLLQVGAHTVRLRSSGTARAGDVTIAGGTLSSSATINVLAGDSFVGFGTISAPVRYTVNAPTTATGTGLVFDRAVTLAPGLPSITMTGTRVVIGAGGSFTGAGAINAAFRLDAGGSVTATDSLILGNNTGAGVDLRGTLIVNPGTVTLRDTDIMSHTPGGVLELRGGSVSTVADYSFAAGTVLRGAGNVTTPHLSSIGTIAPGIADADRTGTIVCTGDLSLGNIGAGATVDIEIEGAQPDKWDTIITGGTASLHSPGSTNTLNVSLLDGFAPPPGSEFSFLLSSDVQGRFDVVHIPSGAVLVYEATRVVLLFPCAADFNLDTGVDFFDYLDFAAAFDAGDPAADFNGDESVDFFDYLDFAAAFDAGC